MSLILFLWPFIEWIIPLCCFFGTILTFVFLEKNKEWTALQACSISPWWISNSMIFASILASGIPLFKMNSNLFSKGFINYPENNNLVIKNSNHETWYFESFDEKKMRGENIQIYVDNDKGDSAYRLRCRSATWSPITGWTFYDGMFLSFLTEKGVPMPNFETKKIDWTPKKIVPWQQDIETENSPVRKVLFSELIISSLDENPRTHLLVMKDPRSLSFNELSKVILDYPNQTSLTLAPFRLQYAMAHIELLSSVIITIAALILVARVRFISVGRTVLYILIGLVVFYVSQKFFCSIGNRGALNAWVSVTCPVVITIAMLVLVSLRRS